MNVFMLTSVPLVPPWDQGDKNLAYMLARALDHHRFGVLTIEGSEGPLEAHFVPFPLFQTRKPSLAQKGRFYCWLVTRTAQREDAFRPRLYHMIYQPYRLSSWLNALVPELRRRPTLHTVPASAVEHPIRRDLFFADRVVALSEFGKARLKQAGLRNVIHIPPGIETARWNEVGEHRAKHKAQLGVEDGPVILYPGHYGPQYGAQSLLDALPSIAAQLPSVRLLFACRPRTPEAEAEERRAKQYVAEAGLSNNVRFFRVVPQVATLIGASDLVVLPLASMRDKIDIPTTLLEALAAGKPIVVSDVPPMTELVQGTGTGDDAVGRVVPAGDSAALTEAILSILTDKDLQIRMAERGKELIKTCYDIHAVAQRYDQLYREMVA